MTLPRCLRVTLACALCLALASCSARKPVAHAPAAPLAAYRVTDQDVRVHFTGGEVRIQASYQVQNTGEAPLDEIRVSLRQVNSSAAYDLTLSIDGADVAWQRFENAADRGLHASIPGGWRPQQTRFVILRYAFRSGSQGMAGGAGGFGQTFQLFPGAWSPILLPPQQAGASGGASPAKWSLSVTVPEGMLVHASGAAQEANTRGGEVEQRFEQSGNRMTFVLAGRYRENVVSAEGFAVHFWSSPRTPEDPQLENVCRRIAAGLKALTAELGPRDVSPQSVWVVFGGGMRYILSAPGVTLSGIAPDVILDAGLLADRTGETQCHTDELLAAMWLSWHARPEPQSAILAEQLARHVAQTYTGGCGWQRYRAQDRTEAIRYLLERHAETQKTAAAAERAAVREGMRHEVQGLAMRLFIFALEDAVGREKLRAGIRRLLQANRGASWSAENLRTALEAESRKKLAPLFAQWIDQPAIPASFAAKYRGKKL